MRKSLIIVIGEEDSFIAWISTKYFLYIKGFNRERDINSWLNDMLNEYKSALFGTYNESSIEIVNRIIEMEEF